MIWPWPFQAPPVLVLHPVMSQDSINSNLSVSWYTNWWLFSQPIWKICSSQTGDFSPKVPGWTIKKSIVKQQFEEHVVDWSPDLGLFGHLLQPFYGHQCGCTQHLHDIFFWSNKSIHIFTSHNCKHGSLGPRSWSPMGSPRLVFHSAGWRGLEVQTLRPQVKWV